MAKADKLLTKKTPPGRPFVPGDPRINRKGRQRGTKNKFGEAFIDAMLLDFEEHGAAVIQNCRERDPSTYIRVAAAILPRQIEQDIDINDKRDRPVSLDWDIITGGKIESQ